MSRFSTSTSKFSKKIVIFIVLILIIVCGFIYLSLKLKNNLASTQSEQNQILAETSLDKDYEIQALGQSGKNEGKVKMSLTKAEKTKEVLVQGKPASAKGDKAFLVLNLEIENSETKPLYVAPVDLYRIIGTDGQKFAADVHSKLVEVQPISTKITRIGFVIDQSQSTFNLQVGELEGNKEDLQINF